MRSRRRDAKGYSRGPLLARVMGEEIKIGKQVAVVGGGNSAIDAARAACRPGSSVTIICRLSRAEMLTTDAEVQAAEEEGASWQLQHGFLLKMAAMGKVSLRGTLVIDETTLATNTVIETIATTRGICRDSFFTLYLAVINPCIGI